MSKEIVKPEKVALCRECHGTGKIKSGRIVKRTEPCPQCLGSGRVLVSCKMTLELRPYKEQ
jgi:DnaJ-class molecular chaperone